MCHPFVAHQHQLMWKRTFFHASSKMFSMTDLVTMVNPTNQERCDSSTWHNECCKSQKWHTKIQFHCVHSPPINLVCNPQPILCVLFIFFGHAVVENSFDAPSCSNLIHRLIGISEPFCHDFPSFCPKLNDKPHGHEWQGLNHTRFGKLSPDAATESQFS